MPQHIGIVASVLASLLLVSVPSPTQAAPRLGTVCTVKGKKAQVGRTSLVCRQTSSGLRWKKRETAPRVTSPATTPTPSPTTSAQPDPTTQVDPVSNFYNFTYEGNTLKRRSSPDRPWRSEDPRTTADMDPIRAKAWSALQAWKRAETLSNFSVTFTVGEHVPPGFEPIYRTLILDTLAFFEPALKGPAAIPVIMYTEKDRELLRSFLSSYTNGSEQYARMEQSLRVYDNPAQARYRSAGGGVTRMYPVGSTAPHQVFAVFMASVHRVDTDLLFDNPVHEAVHAFQFAATPTVPKQNFVSDPSAPGGIRERPIAMPCNLMEGSATFLGVTLGVPHIGWASDGMDVFIRRVGRDSGYPSLTNTDEVVAALISSESHLPGRCAVGFSLGGLLYEWFIAEYGVQAFVDLLHGTQRHGTWEPALREVTGLGRDAFYAAAAPYVLRAWRKVMTP